MFDPPRCEGCRWWAKTNIFAQGQCRRRAPVMVQLTHTEINGWEYSAQWPMTYEGYWCGEHEPRPNEEGDTDV